MASYDASPGIETTLDSCVRGRHLELMVDGLTLKYLIAPITAATILNVILFAVAWRGHQAEMRTGKDPWWLGVGAGAYGLAVAAFVYMRGDIAASSGIDLFAIAAASEAFGGVIVYALLWGFVFTRGQPWRDRAFPIGLAVMLTGGMIAATLKA